MPPPPGPPSSFFAKTGSLEPVTCAGGNYAIVQGLDIDEFSRERMNFTLKELEEERAGVASLLG